MTTTWAWLHYWAGMGFWYIFGTSMSASWLSQRWTKDSVSPPVNVRLFLHPEIVKAAAEAKNPNLTEELLEGVPLVPYLMYRPIFRRMRTWLVILPPGGTAGCERGGLIVQAEVMPPRTRLKLEDAQPPKKPRGGIRIPALRLPSLAPQTGVSWA